MGSRKKINGTGAIPLVEKEYIDLLRDYKKGAKRRKDVKQESPDASEAAPSSSDFNLPPKNESTTPPPPDPQLAQLTSYGSDGESELESDEFEDVELNNDSHTAMEEAGLQNVDLGDVQISLDGSQAAHISRRPKPRGLRKPQRLAIHKLSLMAWMHHARMRNKYLMDPELLDSPLLRHSIPEFILEEVFPKEHLTPFLKSRQFVEGVRHIMESWQQLFKVVRPGLACDQEAMEGNFGDSGSRDEFIASLLKFEGSTDLLGQGFVAFLRSIGLVVRLVCSLQPPDNLGADITVAPAKSRSTESNCPIFWAEVWDEYSQKWMSADPLTSSIRLPTRTKVKLKLEPPHSDRLNVMRYCIALNHRNCCRDVTRRYAKEFNSRARKKRLPHFETEKWLDHFLGLYTTKHYTALDRDELLELSRYPRAEGIPTRVQDFVGHPVYALADHLRSDEIIKPDASPCGVLSTNSKSRSKLTGGNGPTTYIYRRSDVETVRSSQSWYKRGRSIRVGEQPRARRNVRNRLTGELDSVALYARSQTELYVPPPVDPNGIVPKSQYRTIDIFTSSMIPNGGYYIRSKLGSTAAKILRIDFANVVTGVDFGKNGPQSRMFGVIVATSNAEAVREVIVGLREQEAEEAEHSERLRILALWRKFILGIQIWDRVESMNPSYHDDSRLQKDGSEGFSDTSASHDVRSEDQETVPPRLRPDHRSGIHDCMDSRQPHAPHQSFYQPGDVRSGDESDIEIIGTSSLSQKFISIGINTAKLVRLQDKVAQLRKSLASSFSNSPGLGRSIHERGGIEPRPVGSPDSYHSFSDLDVEEISESEL